MAAQQRQKIRNCALGGALLLAMASSPVRAEIMAVATTETLAPTLAEMDRTNDPLESINRSLFKSNLRVDRYFLKPLAQGYQGLVPQIGRDGIRRIINNLRAPGIFFNDVLQADIPRAGETLGRFLINSTIGVAGIYDVAADFGLPYHNEDFGQTLAVWGIDAGPYLMVPFVGPSNPRDMVGLVADIFMDPFLYIAGGNSLEYAIYLREGARILDWRARHLELVKELQEKSVDFYAAVRSLYRQRRDDAIRNGKPLPISPAFRASPEWKK